MKRIIRYAMILLAGCYMATAVSSCSDEPDISNYYTFKGEMISDYLSSRPQFSQFKTVVERAGMMKQLSAYGAYTCFPPVNEAFDTYLKNRGLTSIDQLTDADCDTITRTHLVKNMYATADMANGVIASPNMNRRYIEVSHGLDNDSNAVVFLNRSAHILFELQDD